MLSKRNLYTAMGIALSFVIAVGGWALTSKLIDGKADALLSVTGSVKVPAASSTDTRKEPDENGGESPHVLPRLTATEISAVLQNWESAGRERLHEPTDGQLSMEQAIEAGKAGLAYFCEQGVIPAELLQYEYDRTNVYLYEKQPGGLENNTLNPYYSYWSITFSSDNKRVILIINAVTGQIWDAAISGAFKADSEKLLDTFVSYLGLDNSGSLVTNRFAASKSFADGAFYAAVRIGIATSFTDGDSVSPIFFRMYLSTKAQMIE